MAIELQAINSSGDLTEIKLGGTDAEKEVLTKEQVDALFGNLEIIDDEIVNNIDIAFNVKISKTGVIINAGTTTALIISPNNVYFIGLTIADIDAASTNSAVTKEWVQAEIAAAIAAL